MLRVTIVCDRCGAVLGQGRTVEDANMTAVNRRNRFDGGEYCGGCMAVVLWSCGPPGKPMPPDPIVIRAAIEAAT